MCCTHRLETHDALADVSRVILIPTGRPRKGLTCMPLSSTRLIEGSGGVTLPGRLGRLPVGEATSEKCCGQCCFQTYRGGSRSKLLLVAPSSCSPPVPEGGGGSVMAGITEERRAGRDPRRGRRVSTSDSITQAAVRLTQHATSPASLASIDSPKSPGGWPPGTQIFTPTLTPTRC